MCCVGRACQVEAESIGRFLEDDLAGGGHRSGAVYSWLALNYEQGDPAGEIPDAWLSQMMKCLTTQSLEASGNNALPVRKWLVSIRQGQHFSRRLRAQAAALPCAAPDSF